jgi:hypothetical protein
MFYKYGLGADVSGADPLKCLQLWLAPKPSQRTPVLPLLQCYLQIYTRVELRYL